MNKLLSVLALGLMCSMTANAAVIALHAQGDAQQNCSGEIETVSILASEGVILFTNTSSISGCTILFTNNDKPTGAALTNAIGKKLKVVSYADETQEVILSITK